MTTESHPSPPSDLEGRIAEVLAPHSFAEVETVRHGWITACDCGWQSDFPGRDIDGDKAYRAHLAAQLAEVVKQEKYAAWAEGHQRRWRRCPDDCQCGAWSSIECACGKYGTGELLSLNDNPYVTSEAQR